MTEHASTTLSEPGLQPGHDDHSAAAAHGDAHAHGIGHPMPLPYLFGVFFTLMVLTLLTVTVADLGLGSWDIFVSMTIATIKALLVAMVFMHLMFDKPLNIMIFGFSLVFVGLFIGAALVDASSYQDEVRPYWVEQMQKEQDAGAMTTPAAGETPAPAAESPAESAAAPESP